MLETKIYNLKGEEIERAGLSAEVFGLKINPVLVYQAATSQAGNERRVIAKVKDRSEVKGGGRKPWRQKGTGRARHGSIRSPLWRGGGVTFGPTNERNFKKKINKKMKRQALFMVLSSKVKNNELLLIDHLEVSSAKTKELARALDQLFQKLKIEKKNILAVITGSEKKFAQAGRNLPFLKMARAESLNVLDLLKSRYLLISKNTLDFLNQKYVKEL